MCGTNQTNRYIVCCFQRDYCNDLDAYSTTIRATLICTISTITLTTRQPPEQNSDGRIPSDQSLTALLDEFSTSTVGPG
ncbi:unnamed protein product [Rotaria sp. Silwood1]|nr:unnamed protein product [Rotaria sp. Silwood1]CAF1624962.1 unnamed protein product [Rotaria sp. Silwood1]CAF1625170.1 unnamed protein product [Rotaria sp. Silwood1]CAF3722057.1 unnamed protein product [Rotaria sp. Silwood1]CAF3828176.1 unnamed protein product [Rotaria sp. Silwood1]